MAEERAEKGQIIGTEFIVKTVTINFNRLISAKGYNKSLDMWSVGGIMYVILVQSFQYIYISNSC